MNDETVIPHRVRPAFVGALIFTAAVGFALALLALKVFSEEETTAVAPAAAFNEGNAAYSKNQYGLATWHYARALRESPRDPDILQNLAAAQKAAEAVPSDAVAPAERLAEFLSAEGWVLVACAGLWAVALVLLAMSALHWRGAIPAGILLLCVFVTGVGAVGTFGALEKRACGVVVVKETPLRVAPAAQSPVVGALAEAQFARVLDKRGAYAHVRTQAGKTGWVALSDFYPLY